MKQPALFLTVLLAASIAHGEVLDTSQFLCHDTITFSGYTGGSEVLTDFPVLVKMSPDIIEGFRYYDCAADGSDLRFADASGNVLDHEIDTWDTTGISFAWVRLPSLSGTGTAITLHWCPTVPVASLPAVSASGVWSRYVSVWHINSNLQDSASDANNLSALGRPTTGVPALVGAGCHQDSGTGQCLLTARPIVDAGGNARTVFTLSGWFNPEQSYASRNLRLFSTKGDGEHTGAGFEVIISSNKLLMRGNGNSATYGSYTTAWTDNFSLGSWTHIAAVFNGTSARSFFNGVEKGGGGTIATINENPKKMAIGNTGHGNAASSNVFAGTMDEMRLFDGVPSDAWVKAEYDTVANHGTFTTYSSAIVESPIPMFSVTSPSIVDNAAAFSGNVRNFGADETLANRATSCNVYLAFTPVGLPLPEPTLVATVTIANPSFSFSIGSLAPATDYDYAITIANNFGIPSANSATGRFSTNPNPSFRVTAVNRDANREITSFDLEFGGNASAKGTLFAVYGPRSSSGTAASWTTAERIAHVSGASAPIRYAVPDSWGQDTHFLRFLLVEGRSPDYDTLLEYLVASGAERVVTDYIPTGASIIETKISLTDVGSNSTIFCARVGSGDKDTSFTAFYIKNNDNKGWRYDYHQSKHQTTASATVGTPYTLRMDASGLLVNGAYVYERNDPTPIDFNTGNQMQLFSSYTSSPGTGTGNYAKLKLFYLRTTDNGAVTHEYLPCLRDGVVCLYDTVSDTFLTTLDGELAPGPAIIGGDIAGDPATLCASDIYHDVSIPDSSVVLIR